MKFPSNRALPLLIVSSAFLLAVTSCKKSSNNGGASGSMSATVGSTAWANNYATVGLYASSFGIGLFDIIGLQFKNGDSSEFTLEFPTPITVNLPVNADTAALIITYSDSKSGETYTGMTGGFGNVVLTVTSYDSTHHTIGGTFNGSMVSVTNFPDSILVTNGKFSTNYTVN
ncbi:MAG TPA: hypothetical protein VKR41_10420 [Puia sp.]|nr:hypothetical protein [Puia sp.]